MNWKKIAACLLGAMVSLAPPCPPSGKEFPKAPVKIIIPFPPGGRRTQ
jgi:tripartite-type tricarboxylate transporter receptor subunit TctC